MFKVNILAYNEGRKAYFKGVEVYQNPYSDDQETNQFSWEKGWNEANKEENDFDWTD